MGVETLAIAGLAASGIGAVTGALGAFNQGQATAASDRYAAGVARNNQIIADQNARRAVQVGRVQAQAQDMRNAQRYGAIVAAQGASGVDTESGSSKEVRDAASRLGRLDTQTVMDSAEERARAYNVQAQGFGAQSELDTMAASRAETAGTTGAFTSILGGATSLSDKWIRYKFPGVIGSEASAF